MLCISGFRVFDGGLFDLAFVVVAYCFDGG